MGGHRPGRQPASAAPYPRSAEYMRARKNQFLNSSVPLPCAGAVFTGRAFVVVRKPILRTPSSCQTRRHTPYPGGASATGGVYLRPALDRDQIREYNVAMGTQHWTADEDRLLGTMPDRELARSLGRSRDATIGRRRHLRIPPFSPHGRRWSRLEDELLGTMPDKRLARKFSRSAKTVTKHRLARGIPVFNPKQHHWTPADDKLLGERPEAQIALLLGISRMAVKHRRLRLGLPPLRGRKWTAPPPWRPGEDALLLGTASDRALASRLGRTISTVRRRRAQLGLQSPCHHWTPEEDALLGTMSDQALARRLGRRVKGVVARRRRLRIPAVSAGYAGDRTC